MEIVKKFLDNWSNDALRIKPIFISLHQDLKIAESDENLVNYVRTRIREAGRQASNIQ
jgi:hypothetical protein